MAKLIPQRAWAMSWPNTGPDSADTAVDECIIDYERTVGTYVRHVSVDRDNNVWIGGHGNRRFSLLDGANGAVLETAGSFGCGGYGGLVDDKGVVWSALLTGNGLLRYDPESGQASCLPVYAYGMGMDRDSNIWVARWCQNTISKVAPDGTILFTKSTGGTCSRGVAVTFTDNNVWVANSSSNTVTRLDNNGNVLQTIRVGSMPTGVAVDAAGKVWVTNHNSHNAMRIDPATNQVDLTVDLGPNAQCKAL